MAKNYKKIEWQGNILNTSAEESVTLKGENKKVTQTSEPPKKITGKVCLRLEKKGRAGNPVLVLFKFSDPEANNPANLKNLCSELKTKLACGGTVEDDEIILTYRDMDKLKETLKKFNLFS